ncbi:MAG: Ig-like domain-containing protein, partial [Thioalkalivibrio sp.]|nr:Ig-like domain-containing protein [Thioalkalivibrio sp.]
MIRRLLLGLSLAVVLTACGTPTVLQVTNLVPADGATDVSIDVVVSATFNLALDPATVDGAFTLASTSGDVSGVVAYDAPSRTATFTPDAPLAYATEYTGTVAGSVATTGGVALGGAASWSFTTEAAAPAIGGIDVTPAEDTLVISGQTQLTATPTGVVGSPDLTVT